MTVCSIVVNKTDLMDAMVRLEAGQYLRIATIPAGAIILTSLEDVAEQVMFHDEVIIRYTLDDDPAPTISLGLGHE